MPPRIHAWDCTCGTRNAPPFDNCRQCGKSQHGGHAVYVQEPAPPHPLARHYSPGFWASMGRFVVTVFFLSLTGLALWIAAEKLRPEPLPTAVLALPEVLGETPTEIRKRWALVPLEITPDPYSHLATLSFTQADVRVEIDCPAPNATGVEAPIGWAWVTTRSTETRPQAYLLARVGITDAAAFDVRSVKSLRGLTGNGGYPGEITGVWVGLPGAATPQGQYFPQR